MRGLRGAVIVVDQELHVIAWNHRSEEMWGLPAAEVRNKNVFGLDTGLPIEQFRRGLRACLSGETELANVTVDAINRCGKPVQCVVTCTPLFGKGHAARGVKSRERRAAGVKGLADGKRPADGRRGRTIQPFSNLLRDPPSTPKSLT